MLTSSFACTSSPASVAITSFAFMFEEVPEPVWKTSIGNWSSSSPSAIRVAAAAIRSALSLSSRPSSAFTRAAAPLIRPSQRATGAGIGSPETGKFTTAFAVSPPQSSRSSSVLAIRASVGKPGKVSLCLSDHVQPARGPLRPAPLGALGLRLLKHGHPSEVAALRALRALEVMLELVAARHAGRPALKTLDGKEVHAGSIGRESRPGIPPSRDGLRLPARRNAPCGGDQVVPRAQLDPRPAGFLAGAALDCVDLQPAVVLDDLDAALCEQRVDRRRVRVGLGLKPPCRGILEQQLHGFGGVLLVRPDHTRRATLDPARAV